MKYPLFKVHIDKQSALNKIAEVIDSGFINEGEQVTELTNVMQKRFDTNRLVLTNSCTSALTMALEMSGAGPGKRVVSTPMTCVATNCPIVKSGADVVWADICPYTGCIDPVSVERILEKDDTICAVMAVAWAGNAPELAQLRDICDEHNVSLILDAAHAFDAKYQPPSIPRGSDQYHIHEWADYTCYSFQAIKHITTGDGGMLICRTEDDYQHSKKLKWFGIDRDAAKDDKGNWKGQHWDFDIIHAGFKFNMNNLTAAIGLSQVSHLDDIINKHRANARIYDFEFADFDGITTLVKPRNSQSSHWVYTVLTHRHIRDELVRRLNTKGIGAGLVHVPNDHYTAFRASQKNLPGVREFSERQFSLPVGWWLSPDDVKYIASIVQAEYKELTNG